MQKTKEAKPKEFQIKKSKPVNKKTSTLLYINKFAKQNCQDKKKISKKKVKSEKLYPNNNRQ